MTVNLNSNIEIWKVKKGQRKKMVVLLLLNRQGGGLKMSLYPAFCMRGIDDSLPMCLSIWRTMEQRGTYKKVLESLKALPCALGKFDWSQVVRDPYSIPISRPKDADHGIKTLVTGALQAETQKRYVQNLLKGTFDDGQEKAIINTLSHMTPMSLQLAASVYEKCDAAIAEKLITTFQTSLSILRLVDKYIPFEKIVSNARFNAGFSH